LAAWNAVTASSGLPVKGVSCPTTSACAAVDNNADVIVSTNPRGGASEWSSTNVLPAPQTEKNPLGVQNGMFGISCPAAALCVGVGASENVIASTNPFAADRVPASQRKSGHLRVVITKHPARRMNPRKKGVPVTFRFHAVGSRAAHFKCRLAGGSHGRQHLRRLRFTSCAAAVRYRLGKGKYVFRVRAIDGRRKSSPASFSFRIGHLSERKPVGSCRSAAMEFHPHPCINAR
jgi:hypothetical protein